MPIYTVALGTENGTIQGPDGYGGVRTIRVPPDPETLKQVATLTGGKFFAAADAGALKSVYDKIGSQVGVEHKTRELTVFFTAVGAAPAARRRLALDALVRPDALSSVDTSFPQREGGRHFAPALSTSRISDRSVVSGLAFVQRASSVTDCKT